MSDNSSIPSWVYASDATKPPVTCDRAITREEAITYDFLHLLQAAPDSTAILWVLQHHQANQFSQPFSCEHLQLIHSYQLVGASKMRAGR